MSRKLLSESNKYRPPIKFAVALLRRLADDLESGESLLVDWNANIELEAVQDDNNHPLLTKVWKPTGVRSYYLEIQDAEEGERES